MTHDEIYAILSTIDGFAGQVAYREFHVDKNNPPPNLPYICYLDTSPTTFKADDSTFHAEPRYQIELYTETKSPTTEALVEAALNLRHLPWDKSDTYLDDEKCYQIIYEI